VAQQRYEEQHNEQKEENLGHTGGGYGDSGEAENGGQQSHNEEDESPAQHVQSSWLKQRREFAGASIGAPYSGRRISRRGFVAGLISQKQQMPDTELYV
jgi:hypothetical protein